jgi:hypothetical protein
MSAMNRRNPKLRSKHRPHRSQRVSNRRLENLAALLTEAVYPVALQHDNGASWVDLELAVWSAITETLNRQAAAQLCVAKGE